MQVQYNNLAAAGWAWWRVSVRPRLVAFWW